ncbi:MAG: hypothetical protein Unbinned4388contig1000_54 [Prokaryotic dsDNA virus sp.]|nr:MAG: hypothetical protein Unbinned4388contig1000_54 [Prokaryotic dsDNA virus sp.]|tara:strand:- start:64689 stop:64853 length:165 start_codon:yes stop_codon:yes gene_type:complete
MKTIKSKDGKSALHLDIGENIIFINIKQKDGTLKRVGALSEDFYQRMDFNLKHD